MLRIRDTLGNLFAFIVLLAWALWFGGLAVLILLVVSLFTQDHNLALQAAPRMFHAFERCQLIVAATALIAAFGWRMVRKSAWIVAVFCCLGLAAVGAAMQTTFITPAMDILILKGNTASAQFLSLHKQSQHIYEAIATVLVVAGAMLPTALRHGSNPAKTTEQS